jgi:nucleotide-binding universal stress UspA family protein
MKILLATDASECADTALEFLLRFPVPGNSTVTLLTVIDERAFVDVESVELTQAQSEVLHEVRNTVREEAQVYLDRAAQRIRERGWKATTALHSGDVAEEIVRTAEASGSGLVVVGSHGHGSLGRFLLGGISNRVLMYAPCSVLLVKQPEAGRVLPGTGDEPWRVLLAYDDSDPARKALEFCATLAWTEKDVIEILMALTLVTGFRQDIRQHMSPVWQQKKIAARAALDGAVARLRGGMPGVTSALREGASSAHEIIEAAASGDSNLIVLGSKGKSALQRFLLGSTTGNVARHASCSVLVVREESASGIPVRDAG